MPERWSADQVLALAPDSSSAKAARSLAAPTPWTGAGCADSDPPSLWGLCRGSGKKPYQTCVDLAAPAYRCTCPSRKFPCKHALGLLLLWSSGGVPEADEPPDWVAEWNASRAARKVRRETGPADPEKAAAGAARRAAQREARVAAGLDELDRWLADQVRHGLAGVEHAGYGHWDTMAARLVDAQAPALAGTVRRLAAVPVSGEGWAGRLLAELALLRLITTGYGRRDTLPAPLAAAVRSRVGFPATAEDSPPVRDRWQVLGMRDSTEDKVTTRRVWLRGADTGRPALVLSFAAPGQALDAGLVVGTTLDAELRFFPGAAPLRAVVSARHDRAVAADARGGGTVETVLAEVAAALAAEPWIESWPVLLADAVLVAGDPWHVVDPTGAALPLVPDAQPWRPLAAAGGHPCAVAAEWTPHGLRPLTAWPGGKAVPA